MPPRSISGAAATLLIAELPRHDGSPKEFAGVLALGDGSGLEFKAARGACRKAAS